MKVVHDYQAQRLPFSLTSGLEIQYDFRQERPQTFPLFGSTAARHRPTEKVHTLERPLTGRVVSDRFAGHLAHQSGILKAFAGTAVSAAYRKYLQLQPGSDQ